jgi:hypothetical protein
LRDALGRHAGLVEEDAPEVIAVGEHLRLQGQERAARIHEVDAGEPVLQGHLLSAHVLLHRQRVVGAAFHRGVVGHNHHVAARDSPDARDDARRGRLVFVQAVGRQRRQFEECRAGIDELLDALAHGKLPLLAVALQILRAAALGHARQALAILAHQRAQALVVGLELRGGGVDVCAELIHYADCGWMADGPKPQITRIARIPGSAKFRVYQPQQSVLKRHCEARHTACIRYISAPAGVPGRAGK